MTACSHAGSSTTCNRTQCVCPGGDDSAVVVLPIVYVRSLKWWTPYSAVLHVVHRVHASRSTSCVTQNCAWSDPQDADVGGTSTLNSHMARLLIAGAAKQASIPGLPLKPPDQVFFSLYMAGPHHMVPVICMRLSEPAAATGRLQRLMWQQFKHLTAKLKLHAANL